MQSLAQSRNGSTPQIAFQREIPIQGWKYRRTQIMISKGEIINLLLQLRGNKTWLFRLKTIAATGPTTWSSFFIHPTDNYIETDPGPIAFREIDYIDINVFEEIEIGKLVPKKKLNNSNLIQTELQLQNAPYLEFEEFIRIPFRRLL